MTNMNEIREIHVKTCSSNNHTIINTHVNKMKTTLRGISKFFDILHIHDVMYGINNNKVQRCDDANQWIIESVIYITNNVNIHKYNVQYNINVIISEISHNKTTEHVNEIHADVIANYINCAINKNLCIITINDMNRINDMKISFAYDMSCKLKNNTHKELNRETCENEHTDILSQISDNNSLSTHTYNKHVQKNVNVKIIKTDDHYSQSYYNCANDVHKKHMQKVIPAMNDTINANGNIIAMTSFINDNISYIQSENNVAIYTNIFYVNEHSHNENIYEFMESTVCDKFKNTQQSIQHINNVIQHLHNDNNIYLSSDAILGTLRKCSFLSMLNKPHT